MTGEGLRKRQLARKLRNLGMTLAEIGLQMSLSRERVRQLFIP